MHHPTDRITHTTAFVTPHRGALAGTRNSSMGPPHEGSIRRPIAPWANALITELYLFWPSIHIYIYISQSQWYIHTKLELGSFWMVARMTLCDIYISYHTHTCILYLYVCYVCMYVCMYVCIYACMCVYVRTYVYIYVWVCIYKISMLMYVAVDISIFGGLIYFLIKLTDI